MKNNRIIRKRQEIVSKLTQARLEKGLSQAQLAEMVGTSAPYISRLINKKDGIVNKVFVEMLEKLGYDIQITYVKK
jgi:transcriptional regulator with XRE-family HTH domain